MRRTSRDIRLANRFAVMRHIIAASPVSRQQLTTHTGLSFATVADLVGELLELGMLAEVGQEASGGGRPRGLVAVSPDAGVLIGVELAETYVHVEVFNPALTRLAWVEEELHPEKSMPDQVVQRIVASVRAGIDVTGIPDTRALGVGVAVPGQVDRDGEVSIFAPSFDWQDVPLRRMLEQQLRLPVCLDSQIKASTVAELWFGAARGLDDVVVVVTLGTGVGAGLAVDGALYRGATNNAGEWGHTTLSLGGRECRCGSRGCVEAYVGALGIMQQLRELDPASPLLHPDDQAATIDALARAAADDDPVAAKVLADAARYLGAGLANLVNLVNPQVIVVSGWVAERLGGSLLEQVRAEVARLALRLPVEGTAIIQSPLDRNPVSLGAATFALEWCLSRLGQAERADV